MEWSGVECNSFWSGWWVIDRKISINKFNKEIRRKEKKTFFFVLFNFMVMKWRQFVSFENVFEISSGAIEKKWSELGA